MAAATALHQRMDERRRQSMDSRDNCNSNTNHLRKSYNGFTSVLYYDSMRHDDEEGMVHESSPRMGSRYAGVISSDDFEYYSRRGDASTASHFDTYAPRPKPEHVNNRVSAPKYDDEKKQHRPPNSYARDGDDRRDKLAPPTSFYSSQDKPFRNNSSSEHIPANAYHSNKHHHPHQIISLEEKRSLRDNEADMCNPPLPLPREGWGKSAQQPQQERNGRYLGNRGNLHRSWKGDKTYHRDDRNFRNHRSIPRYYENDRHRGRFERDERDMMRGDSAGKDRDFRRQKQYDHKDLSPRYGYNRSDSGYQRDELSKNTKTFHRPPRRGMVSDRGAVDRMSRDECYESTRPLSVAPRVDRYEQERIQTRAPALVKPEESSKVTSIKPRVDERPPQIVAYKSEPTDVVQPRAVAASVKNEAVSALPVRASPFMTTRIPNSSMETAKRSLDDKNSECTSPPKKRWRMTMQNLDNCNEIPSFDAMEAEDTKPSIDASERLHAAAAAAEKASTAPSSTPVLPSKPVVNIYSKPIATNSKPASIKQSSPPPQKPAGKLGIPLRWLKPAAKPKETPLAKKPNIQTESMPTTLGQIPRKSKPVAATNSAQLDPSPNISAAKANSVKASNSTAKGVKRPTTPPNRLVTDASEGSSTLSNHLLPPSVPAKAKLQKVPSAIVTKIKKVPPAERPQKPVKTVNSAAPTTAETDCAVPKTKKLNTRLKTPFSVSPLEDRYTEPKEDEWHADDSDDDSSESESEIELESDSESEMDEDETERWAEQLLGKSPSPEKLSPTTEESLSTPERKKFRIRLSLKKFNKSPNVSKYEGDKKESVMDDKEREKLMKKKKKETMKKKASMERSMQRKEFDEEKARKEMEEERRKREEAKPLTAAEIKAILGEDDFAGANQSNWVRRSSRKPSAALLNSKPVKMLMDKLRYNDPEMKVLKMKKFIADPNAPSEVLDAALNAMEENSNCEALYIQNFNEGMRDQQVLHLLRILQQPSCKIWCLNIGENYNVGDDTWEKFTKGLVHTKITHMYASEHTITGEMKDEIRETIRENRKKHNMHNDPNNLDVIIQCTHCWWNPINAKVLRPYLKKKGYEHILNDKEAQGLQGSTSAAPTV